MKKNNILELLLLISTIVAMILVGAPTRYNCIELNIIIIIIGTIYGLYKTIIKKEKIISSKLDIILLLFLTTPMIPLIFKRYDSLTQTITAILINISNYNIYLILRNMLKNQKEKTKKIIIDVIILGGIIIALFGIDEMGADWAKDIKEAIETPLLDKTEQRMISTIGYANSFAIIMAIGILLSLHKTEIGKEYNSSLIFLFLSCLLLSYSRGAILVMILGYMLYLIISQKEKNKYDVLILVINSILAIAYLKVFDKSIATEKYMILWIVIAIFMMISALTTKIISLYYDKIQKTKKRTYFIIGAVCIAVLIILYIIGKQMIVPLHIFNEGGPADDVKYMVYDIEPNTEYACVFNIDAKSEGYSTKHYSIEIVEEDKYYDTICKHKFEFCNYTGGKRIEFKTSPETVEISIYFKNEIQKAQRGVTISELYINQKKYPLKYAYLPEKLVSKIESIKTKNKSVWERLEYYKDSAKIIKDNWLFGTGGYGWKYNYKDVQAYNYDSLESHSYITKIFIENGITSIILFTILCIYTICIIVKKIKNKKLELVDLSFIVLMVHSCIDLNLSIYCISVIATMLFAVITSDDENEKTNNRLNILLITLMIVINIITLTITGMYYKKENVDEKFIDTIADDREHRLEKILKYKETENILYIDYCLMLISYDNATEEQLQDLYEYLSNRKIIADTEYNINKNEIIEKVFKETKSKKIAKKFANIIIEENEKMIENINDKEKNRLSRIEIQQYLEEQEKIYNEAIKINEGL